MNLTIEDIERPEVARQFKPPPGNNDLNFGYSASAYWLKLSLTAKADAEKNWLLEIGYPSLDRVDFFMRSQGVLTRQSAGDLMPFPTRPFIHRNLVFPLTLAPETEQTIYLRVTSEGSLTIPATLWTPAALHTSDQYIYSILALYFGMLLALSLYNLLLYFSLRDRIYLAYVGCATWMMVAQLSMLGLGNQFLWPNWPTWGDIALPSGFSLTGFFGAIFTRLFLNTKERMPRLDKVILGIQAGFIAAALAPAIFTYRPAAIATALLGTAFSTTGVLCGLLALKRRHPGARLFLIAWSVLLVGVAILGMRTLSWLPTNIFTTYGMQIGSVVEMLLLSFALADRIHTLRRDKEEAQAEVLQSKQNAMDALRQSEKLLAQRIAERTAELAEANERLQKSETALREQAHHDPLTGLANRTLLHDELSRTIARCRRSESPFALLMLDLDGFKAVNDTYGHAIGDQLLVEIAQNIKTCLRSTDLAARIGGDEFVVILEDRHEEEQAVLVGNKLIAALSQPLSIAGHYIEIGASIGIAFWPNNAQNIDNLMQMADQAMYSAKQAGRGRCHLAPPHPLQYFGERMSKPTNASAPNPAPA